MWGQPFVEQNFVWVLDQSCSMAWGTPPPIDQMQAEVTAAIDQLQPGQQFNVIRFSSSFALLSATLLDATQGNRDAAVQWVNGITPTGSTCAASAVVAALAQVSNAPGPSALLYVGDGGPNCPGAASELATIAAANTAQIPIHTFLLGNSGGASAFLQQLAAQNGGVFIDPANLPPPPSYRRGDANSDGSVNLTDAVFILGYLFLQGPLPLCPDAADVDDSDTLQLTDVITVLQYLFLQAPPPPAPGPFNCGLWVPGALGPCVQASCP